MKRNRRQRIPLDGVPLLLAGLLLTIAINMACFVGWWAFTDPTHPWYIDLPMTALGAAIFYGLARGLDHYFE